VILSTYGWVAVDNRQESQDGQVICSWTKEWSRRQSHYLRMTRIDKQTNGRLVNTTGPVARRERFRSRANWSAPTSGQIRMCLLDWKELGTKYLTIIQNWDRGAEIPNVAATNRGMRMLLLIALICCGPAQAHEHPDGPSPAVRASAGETPGVEATAVASKNELESRALPRLTLRLPSRKDRDSENTATSSEPFGRQQMIAVPTEVSAKWVELQSRIHSEEETLAACRSGDGTCPAAARRFLDIIELGRQRQGRARLGEINRAVNMSVKPVSDWAQYGVDDFWSAPLATLSAGAGDCEDYAIVKYMALGEAGIVPEDLRLMIVRDIKRKTDHAVVAVRHDEEWLILDNRTLIIVNAEEARHYNPLFVLDHRGVRAFGTAAIRR
jgi:predicted transglutaminase-like cysteine proteinase